MAINLDEIQARRDAATEGIDVSLRSHTIKEWKIKFAKGVVSPGPIGERPVVENANLSKPPNGGRKTQKEPNSKDSEKSKEKKKETQVGTQEEKESKEKTILSITESNIVNDWNGYDVVLSLRRSLDHSSNLASQNVSIVKGKWLADMLRLILEDSITLFLDRKEEITGLKISSYVVADATKSKEIYDARTDLPACVAEIRRLNEKVAMLEDHIDSLKARIEHPF